MKIFLDEYYDLQGRLRATVVEDTLAVRSKGICNGIYEQIKYGVFRTQPNVIETNAASAQPASAFEGAVLA